MEKVTEMERSEGAQPEHQGVGVKVECKPDGMTLDEFKKAVGADRVEVVETATPTPEQTKARLADLMSGKTPPPNDFVAYLLAKLKAGTEEFGVVQRNVKELNDRLIEFQKRAIQIQGEQNQRVQDVMAWWDRNLTGGEPEKKEKL